MDSKFWRPLVLLALGVVATTAACLRPQTKDEKLLPTRGGAPAPDVDALIAQMTLDEKIGQMTQADRKALVRDSDITRYFLGSVLNGGDSVPRPNNARAWAEMYDGYQRAALATRLAIPMIYGVDAVHGHNGVHGAVIFPHNIGLGCTRDPALVEEVARITAREVAGTGLDWAFAPCIAVPRDERWGRTYEGFAETPDLTESLGAAAVRGLQRGLTDPQAPPVLACAKHFVGDGGTTGGRDQGDTQISEEELRAIHLPGYIAAIKEGVGSIMVSYSSWNGTPMHGNRRLITDVLKGELGFTGFVVTDWEAIDKMPGDYTSDVVTAINAGIDMVMVPNRFKDFITTLRKLVETGRVPMSRIDDAVRRILKQKVRLKLWELPYSDRRLTATIGSPAHREVARVAVRKSLVLLKNQRAALPLSRTARIHVMGRKADDIGVQCGGWTVSWQGRRGPITVGTSLLAGLRQVAGPNAAITFSADGRDNGSASADINVVVIGELPYAEGKGDRPKLTLSAEDIALVAAARQSGKPVVVVLLSGRPMILDSVLTDADALMAAWLPGSEGQGVADVLFGDHPPTGKLSNSWPRSMDQVPINHGDAAYDPLFPYGFGLDYGYQGSL